MEKKDKLRQREPHTLGSDDPSSTPARVAADCVVPQRKGTGECQGDLGGKTPQEDPIPSQGPVLFRPATSAASPPNRLHQRREFEGIAFFTLSFKDNRHFI